MVEGVTPAGTPTVWLSGSAYPQVVTAFVQNFSPACVAPTTALIGEQPAGTLVGTEELLAKYDPAADAEHLARVARPGQAGRT